MNKLDVMLEDADIVFDNPDARIPLALVSRLDLQALIHAVVQECLDICEEMGDKGQDGHFCSDEINKRFKDVV